jgi:hypothetical protein
MQKSQAERRRSVRISPKGTVLLAAGEHVERGRIANISSGGLLAITDERPPEALLDAEVDIELRLDSASSGWLRLAGRVKRIGAHEIAVAIESSEPFVRLMEDNATASNEHRRARAVIIVDVTPERRASIANAFRTAGCAVLEVSTPLEAIVRLGELQFEPDLIAIADSLPSSTSDDLRHFVEREHPSVKLVTIGDDLQPPGPARIRDLLGR